MTPRLTSRVMNFSKDMELGAQFEIDIPEQVSIPRLEES